MTTQRERKIKILFDEEVSCAHCGKSNKITVEKETIVAPEPGEYEIRVKAEKGKQLTLEA